jgi:hypothetical protein
MMKDLEKPGESPTGSSEPKNKDWVQRRNWTLLFISFLTAGGFGFLVLLTTNWIAAFNRPLLLFFLVLAAIGVVNGYIMLSPTLASSREGPVRLDMSYAKNLLATSFAIASIVIFEIGSPTLSRWFSGIIIGAVLLLQLRDLWRCWNRD